MVCGLPGGAGEKHGSHIKTLSVGGGFHPLFLFAVWPSRGEGWRAGLGLQRQFGTGLMQLLLPGLWAGTNM